MRLGIWFAGLTGLLAVLAIAVYPFPPEPWGQVVLGLMCALTATMIEFNNEVRRKKSS